ncbi:hypothetical protein U3A91_000399 [Cronobacter sakazakii]|nr:hypothetical protein [Cronobacter sakazakii]
MPNTKPFYQAEVKKSIRREQFIRTVNARCGEMLRQALEAKRQQEKRS